ncbi:hypothetical protein N781_12635 [Pontibacillus halophilus JSM 076056 = DSM 19796]|uniref:Pyridoxal phosphate homeostasis protein n=1 Tax=Pontibacillus halophilus JSM 076056 = DSM 19796 TaxID=1385510 RepID=A0A0A5GMM6_9BACI|nr:YggS family pyridoxal phosphate-dependent enzyme [Pontibacillus halophilus]KGX93249.1 hypothetical protein N781_12635 [Pontibacillus halophilus JSM 076056 = DSM 19796]
MNIKENAADIQRKVEAASEQSGRSASDVTVIAVTKYVSVERAHQAVEAGITHLGENRPEGLIEKQTHLSNGVTWHFIGSLQSKKVKRVIDGVDVLHSLDRLSLAKEIQKRSERVVPCFIQVNVSGEESKQGLSLDEVHEFVNELEAYDRIKVIGLMTMAPYIDDEDELRSCFRRLRLLRDEIQDLGLSHAPCTELSMGMSNDYTIAIEEGATHIRIGTSLVGNEQKE